MKKEIKKLLPFALVVLVLYLVIYYWTSAEWVLKTILRASIPLICGCVIAFVVNILMEFYKKLFFPKSKKSAIVKMRTPVCMTAAYLTIILLLNVILQKDTNQSARAIINYFAKRFSKLFSCVVRYMR